jgi:hypothetical protein
VDLGLTRSISSRQLPSAWKSASLPTVGQLALGKRGMTAAAEIRPSYTLSHQPLYALWWKASRVETTLFRKRLGTLRGKQGVASDVASAVPPLGNGRHTSLIKGSILSTGL